MKKIVMTSVVGVLMAGLVSCGNNSAEKNEGADSTTSQTAKRGITMADWGESDGQKVHLFTLTNKDGNQVQISDYGATITSWMAPDAKGNKNSIVLGYNDLQGYLNHPPYFGATIGRYGNRIGDAKFTLDGKTYKLAANNGKNHLHGGLKGFDKVVWSATPINADEPKLTLNYTSKDNEEGYPGNLIASVTFSFSDDNELQIEYNAETDKATPVNLTNHSYFNLSGSVDNTILGETLMINADRYTPVDTTLIPTGELKPVKGTPFDFTTPTVIGSRIDQVPGGYDHNWVLNKQGTDLDKIAVLTDSISGRQLEVYTTEPGLQFYTGNFLDGTLKTDTGKPIQKNTALCLETQHFPDSPNKPNFPSTILKPGDKYHTTTKYKLVVNK